MCSSDLFYEWGAWVNGGDWVQTVDQTLAAVRSAIDSGPGPGPGPRSGIA